MVAGGINFLVHYACLERRAPGALGRARDAALLGYHSRGHGTRRVRPPAVGRGGWRDCRGSGGGAQVHSLPGGIGARRRPVSRRRTSAPTTIPAASKLVFLLLMVVGGCVGSTGGGIKVLRVGILYRMIRRQVLLSMHGPACLHPVVVDGEVVGPEELRRVAALFFAWMGLLAFGGLVTALLTQHGAIESASGMFSALGNIGPCYISASDMRRPPNDRQSRLYSWYARGKAGDTAAPASVQPPELEVACTSS